MTTREERTRALQYGRIVLEQLAALGRARKSGNAANVKAPLHLARMADMALRHYPCNTEIDMIADQAPTLLAETSTCVVPSTSSPSTAR